MKSKIVCTLFILLIGIASYVVGKHSCSKKKGLCIDFIQDCPSFPKDNSYVLNEKKTGKPKIKIKLHDFSGMNLAGLAMLNDILHELYDVEFSDDNYNVIIDGGYPGNPLPDKDVVKIYYTWEPLTPDVSKYDFAMGFDYIDHPNYIRLPLYYVFYRDMISNSFDRGKCEPLKKVNFASFLITNYGYHEKLDGCDARNRMFHKLSLYKKVASGGKAMNNLGNIVPYSDTFSWVAKSKFMISFENKKHNGYMTEKVAQAYIGGAIPIWYGDRAALKDVNPKAIIYYDDFESEDALIDYVKKVDNDDELYCKIWNEPLINDESKNYSVVKEKLKARIKEVIDNKLYK